MSRPFPRPTAVVLYALLLVAGVPPLAGCGVPPELQQSPGPAPYPAGTTSPTGPTPSAPAPPPEPTPTASPVPSFAEDPAVGCDGHPGRGEMITVLRTEGLLAAGAIARVTRGPLCAGSWQYAVVSVPDRDPLQVVTRGTPDALVLVATGTDVCTVEVRVNAPLGVRTAASCVG